MVTQRVGSASFLMGAVLLIVVTGCGADGVGRSADPAAVTAGPAPESSVVAATIGPAVDPVAEATPPTWLTQFADYPRYLWHLRRLAIATTNSGDAPIEVTSIALRADHFTHLDAEEKSSVIPPGARVDLQVDFGELVDCTATEPLDASVEIALRIGEDPIARAYTVAIDPEPLDDMRQTECRQQAVTDAVAIGFDDHWELVGDTISAGIVVDRVDGDEPIRVDSLRGTEIFVMQPVRSTEDLAVTLHPGEPTTVIPVQLRVLRCDPHAVGQSTRTFEFKTWVAVGDGDAQLIVLDPGTRLREGLAEILSVCLESSSG